MMQDAKCAIVLDSTLSRGAATNAAAIVALTLGARHPELVGPDTPDRAGVSHVGLVMVPVPVLEARREDLVALRQAADAAGLFVVAFSEAARQAPTYPEYAAKMAEATPETNECLGIAVYGPRNAVNRVMGHLRVLGDHAPA